MFDGRKGSDAAASITPGEKNRLAQYPHVNMVSCGARFCPENWGLVCSQICLFERRGIRVSKHNSFIANQYTLNGCRP
jgi:hypothetical protein